MESYEKNRIRSARHGEMDGHKLDGGSCLAKRMRSDRLSECLRSCWLDLIPTDESVFCKMKKQKGRTSPDGNAGDLDRNDHFDQWRSYMKELPAE